MLTGIGIVVLLSLQAIVNIGGVTGAMPMTGVTLPFISYGGSSLLSTMIMVGLLLNITKQVKQQLIEDKEIKES
jgi:cell division protein FtsW